MNRPWQHRLLDRFDSFVDSPTFDRFGCLLLAVAVAYFVAHIAAAVAR